MKKLDTKTFVEIALLMAIAIIMSNTPLGTIRTPFLVVSIVTIPVAIAAIITGPIGGTIVGLTFGICSFISALTGASGMLSALFIVSPFGVFVTAIGARTLEVFLDAWIFKLLRKAKLGKFSYYIAALCCPLLNTLLFMSSLVLFFYHSDYVQNLASGLGTTSVIGFVIALVGLQALIEAAAGCLIGGTVALALAKALKTGN